MPKLRFFCPFCPSCVASGLKLDIYGEGKHIPPSLVKIPAPWSTIPAGMVNIPPVQDDIHTRAQPPLSVHIIADIICAYISRYYLCMTDWHTGTRAHGHTGTRAHGHTGTRAHGHTGTQ